MYSTHNAVTAIANIDKLHMYLLCYNSELVNEDTVNPTTILSSIARTRHIAILFVYRCGLWGTGATPFNNNVWSEEERSSKRRHIQHSTPNSTPANIYPLHASRQYSTLLIPPVICVVSNLLSFESLFMKRRHPPEVPLPKKE